HVHLLAELGLDVLEVLAGELPLVQRLQRAPARAAALGAELGLTVGLLAHQEASLRSRLTISMAPRAASAPLLPALVPERSMACSMESTVSTPKATGTSSCSMATPMPLAHSPATYSKW